jgi:hypothetical protein
MTDEIQIGDYVEVDIGMGLGAIGVVVTEDQYKALISTTPHRPNQRPRLSTSYRIRFMDESTHTALASECRKLTDKELFKAKLSNDKRIYEI